MLESYIEELVKYAGTQRRLDAHLEELAKKAAREEEDARFLKSASVEELAKLAGVALPEDVCGGCGGQMTKLGSIFQCECGRVKKAAASCPGGKLRSQGEGKGKGRGKGKGPMGIPVGAKTAAIPIPGAAKLAKGAGKTVGGLKNLATNAPSVAQILPNYKTAAKRDMPHFTEQDRPKKVKEIYSALKRDHPDMPAGMKARIASRQGKPGKQHQGPPYKGPLTKDKSASVECFAAAFGSCGGDIDKALVKLEKDGYTKLAFNLSAAVPALKSIGSKAVSAVKPAIGAAKGKAQQVAGTFQAARQGGAGVGKSVMQTAKAHPGVAMGTAGAAGFGVGALASNQSKTADDKQFRHFSEKQLRSLNVGSILGGLAGSSLGGYLGYKGGRTLPSRIARTFGGGVAGGLLGAAFGMGLPASFIDEPEGRPATPEEVERIVQQAEAEGTTDPGWLAAQKGKKYLDKSGAAKVSSLMEVGDAAGRIMAKMAEGTFMPNVTGQPALSPGEIEEAIQNAQEREDIEGRAQQWGRRGTVAGGLGGGALGAGAGFGVGKLLKAKAPLAAGVGALGGAALGGLYGRRVGQAEGAEEAVADKLLSMLRARRAFGAGAGHGYVQGLTQGFGANQFPRESEEGPQ